MKYFLSIHGLENNQKTWLMIDSYIKAKSYETAVADFHHEKETCQALSAFPSTVSATSGVICTCEKCGHFSSRTCEKMWPSHTLPLATAIHLESSAAIVEEPLEMHIQFQDSSASLTRKGDKPWPRNPVPLTDADPDCDTKETDTTIKIYNHDNNSGPKHLSTSS